MTVLVNKNNTEAIEKYIIPKSQETGNSDFVEITIDYSSNTFVAQKIKGEINISDDWEVYNDFTFPSSLLKKFLHHKGI